MKNHSFDGKKPKFNIVFSFVYKLCCLNISILALQPHLALFTKIFFDYCVFIMKLNTDIIFCKILKSCQFKIKLF